MIISLGAFLSFRQCPVTANAGRQCCYIYTSSENYVKQRYKQFSNRVYSLLDTVRLLSTRVFSFCIVSPRDTRHRITSLLLLSFFFLGGGVVLFCFGLALT